MPWLTVHTHVTPEDALLYEELLDQLAQDDKQATLRAAYTPLAPSNLDRIMSGWELIDVDPSARCDHHD
jgi:hypothetical protein